MRPILNIPKWSPFPPLCNGAEMWLQCSEYCNTKHPFRSLGWRSTTILTQGPSVSPCLHVAHKRVADIAEEPPTLPTPQPPLLVTEASLLLQPPPQGTGQLMGSRRHRATVLSAWSQVCPGLNANCLAGVEWREGGSAVHATRVMYTLVWSLRANSSVSVEWDMLWLEVLPMQTVRSA